jgi:hypothetical protein
MAALIVSLLLPSPVIAWSGAGHMVIAAQAYRELPPAVRSQVNEILKSHPEFGRWTGSFDPGSAELDLPLFVFMKASTWADEIRRKGNGFDHPHWHYVNYPLKPPGFQFEPGPAPHDDILYGIEQSEKAIGDKGSSAEERAVYLAWLIHLIGDLHQPLHCSALITETYPAGDKGGNDFYVKPASKGIKLHSLWDGLLGTRNHPQTQLNDAIRLAAAHPRQSLPELKIRSPKEWSLEARLLAIEKGYLHGQLKGSTEALNAPELPDNYTKEAKVIAEKQAALAGYRLANAITACVH